HPRGIGSHGRLGSRGSFVSFESGAVWWYAACSAVGVECVGVGVCGFQPRHFRVSEHIRLEPVVVLLAQPCGREALDRARVVFQWVPARSDWCPTRTACWVQAVIRGFTRFFGLSCCGGHAVSPIFWPSASRYGLRVMWYS